jgi:hypothetical protein
MSAGQGSGLALNVGEQRIRVIVHHIRQCFEGRSNAVGTCTLSSTGATSTSVTATCCGLGSHVSLTPLTLNASNMKWHINSTDVYLGSFVVQHTSSTSTDLTFSYGIQG